MLPGSARPSGCSCPTTPLLASFFGAGAESFRVVDLERAQGLVRDHVIFSPGYGRTPHGRALHNPSVRCPPRADGTSFALAMTRARRSMHVLSLLPARRPGPRPAWPMAQSTSTNCWTARSPATPTSEQPASRAAEPVSRHWVQTRSWPTSATGLRARGARVWHQYDGVLDMVAAADPVQHHRPGGCRNPHGRWPSSPTAPNSTGG